MTEDLAELAARGVRAFEAGDLGLASELLGAACARDPSRAELQQNLGLVLLRKGDWARSAEAFGRAVALGLDSSPVRNAWGRALAEDGRLAEAEGVFRGALALAEEPAILVNLANAVGDQGRVAESVALYERALALDPGLVPAWYDLFAALHDEDPARAESCLRRALAARPDHVGSRFQLGALLALRGDGQGAQALLEDLPDHLASSLSFALRAGGRVFTDGFRLLDFALAAAPEAGLVLELGVRRGTWLRWLARRLGPEVSIHGFDSFEGLPEAWGPLAAGAYSTRGELPEVPANVTLHAGWFDRTLPPFVEAHAGPVRFLNVDCDLHSSTKQALDVLGPRLVPGSVVVFDEYLCNPGWEGEEHRALLGAAERFGFGYDHLAVSLFSRQVAIRVR